MIGGIVANNASGMCCGTAQNSYHTLAGMRVVLADGTRARHARCRQPRRLRDAAARAAAGLAELARATRANAALASRIRHKYRMKNTTGYGLNALVDFDDPVDILAHLMIGSEGTLGFISEITYRTVTDHAAQGQRADPVRPISKPLQRGQPCSSTRRWRRSNCWTARRCARCRTSPACRRSCASCRPMAPRCWSRPAPRPPRRWR